MPAINYASLVAVANQLIADSGQRGALRRFAAGGTAFNPKPGLPTDHDADFVLLDFTTDEIINGEGRILSSDQKALVSPGTLPIVPSSDDILVEADGTTWTIIPPIRTLRPATTTLLYTLQVRGQWQEG